jgi:hypothetical protein
VKLPGLAYRLKPDVVAAVILAAMIIAIWAPRAVGPLDVRWDGGVYYVLGTAIAEGKGYRLLNEPGDIEATQYPPLLPLIVACHQWLLGSSDFVVVGRSMRLSYFLIFTAYIFVAYAVLRRHLSLPWALLAAGVVLLHPQMTFLSDLCFAELPFALASTLFVLLAGRQTGPVRSVAAGTCAVAAYLLRTTGVALLAAWVLDALFARRFRTAAIRAVVALVPIMGWNAYIVHVERSPDYTRPAYAYQRADYLFYNVSYARNLSLRDPFRPERGRASLLEVAHRALVNLAHMPKSLGTAVSARAQSWERIKEFPILDRVIPWKVVLYLPIVIGVVVLIGVASLLFRESRLIGLYLLLTAASICLTPSPWQTQWERYWAPATPFLALALASGLRMVATWSERLPEPVRRMSQAGRIILVITVLAMEVVTITRMYVQYSFPATLRDPGGHVVAQHLFFYGPDHQALVAGLDWLGNQAGPDDVVAATMPQWVYMLTGLKSVMPPFERDPVRAQALLDSVPVRFVVVDSAWPHITRTYTLPLLESSPERWRLVYSNPSGRLEIYQRRPEPSRSRP